MEIMERLSRLWVTWFPKLGDIHARSSGIYRLNPLCSVAYEHPPASDNRNRLVFNLLPVVLERIGG